MNSKLLGPFPHSVESLDEELIIALDFGTTFSGVAYAFSNSSKSDVFSVLDWPGEYQSDKGLRIETGDSLSRTRRSPTAKNAHGHQL